MAALRVSVFRTRMGVPGWVVVFVVVDGAGCVLDAEGAREGTELVKRGQYLWSRRGVVRGV